MFLRRNRRQKNGQQYEYWTLVESHRTERGPRQRVVATLGKLPGLDEEERAGWEEAVAAYRATLAEWTPQTNPFWHPIAQQNLPIARAKLAGRYKRTFRD